VNNPIIGIRSFSDEPENVIQYGREFFRGLSDQGVAACGKHYPGHGHTEKDSHTELPICPFKPSQFYKESLPPFEAMAKEQIDSILVAHILFPSIAPEVATFSAFLVDRLLREKLNYQGLVMTDCLEMGAIKDNFSPREIALGVVKAGIDVLVASHTTSFQQDLLDSLLFYVEKGEIPESRIDESIERIMILKNKFFQKRRAKQRIADNAKKTVRGNRRIEEQIAEQSITLLKNDESKIPLDRGEDFLILEMPKVKAPIPIVEAEKSFMLAETAKMVLKNVDFRMIGFDEEVSAESFEYIKDYTNVLIGVYSRNPALEDIQAEIVNQLIALRTDIMVVALGNPYDIRKLPEVKTYIATYGFRKVQLEAFFKILCGEIRPQGKLPITINHSYKKGFGMSV